MVRTADVRVLQAENSAHQNDVELKFINRVNADITIDSANFDDCCAPSLAATTLASVVLPSFERQLETMPIRRCLWLSHDDSGQSHYVRALIQNLRGERAASRVNPPHALPRP